MQPGNTAEYGPKGEWMACLLTYYSKAVNMMVCPTAKDKVPPNELKPTGTVQNWGVGAGGNAGTTTHCYTSSLTVVSPVGRNIDCSYTYNGWFYASSYVDQRDQEGGNVQDPGWVYGKESMVRYSAQTPLFSDGNWIDAVPAEQDSPAANLYTGCDPSVSGIKRQMGRVTLQRHAYIAGSASRNYKASWVQSPPRGGICLALVDGHAEFTPLGGLYSYAWHRNWGQKLTVLPGTPQ